MNVVKYDVEINLSFMVRPQNLMVMQFGISYHSLLECNLIPNRDFSPLISRAECLMSHPFIHTLKLFLRTNLLMLKYTRVLTSNGMKNVNRM